MFKLSTFENFPCLITAGKYFEMLYAKLVHLGVFTFDLQGNQKKTFYSLNILFPKVLIAVVKSPKWRAISIALNDLENTRATVNFP